MKGLLEYPLDIPYILRKKNHLLKEYRKETGRKRIRLAVLGGSSTQDIVKLTELFLMNDGLDVEFYESDYGKYYETVIYTDELDQFKPDIVYIHTSIRNLSWFPTIDSDQPDVEERINNELNTIKSVINKLKLKTDASIIVNNYEFPKERILGNYDAVHKAGTVRYIRKLNQRLSDYIEEINGVNLLDINYISSMIGLDNWFDDKLWYLFGYGMSLEGQVYIAKNISNIIRAIRGNSLKCIVLDLDNTLWNGVVGDDGIQGISIGGESPQGKAHLDFQKYLKRLYDRGVTLAICSKNELENAREGLNHENMVLKEEFFSNIKANWNPKHENVQKIIEEINIGKSSVVFIDDNPMERDIVKQHIKEVKVPKIGDDPSQYIAHLDRNGYFEVNSISTDDINRNTYYKSNVKRISSQSDYSDYIEFLTSLEMVAEIDVFDKKYMNRILQLTNKTNQFNLTTTRMNMAEIDLYRTEKDRIGLYAKLRDRFGDNGLVSVMACTILNDVCCIDLWLMSCRVFKRDLEFAVFNDLVKKLEKRNIKYIRGVYIQTNKNQLVENIYKELGFSKVSSANGKVQWEAKIDDLELKRVDFIKTCGGIKNDF